MYFGVSFATINVIIVNLPRTRGHASGLPFIQVMAASRLLRQDVWPFLQGQVPRNV